MGVVAAALFIVIPIGCCLKRRMRSKKVHDVAAEGNEEIEVQDRGGMHNQDG